VAAVAVAAGLTLHLARPVAAGLAVLVASLAGLSPDFWCPSGFLFPLQAAARAATQLRQALRLCSHTYR
jgi:ABC-type cobalamin transport system ATPase subunit